MSSRDQWTVSPVRALNPEMRKSPGLRRIAGQSGAIRRSSTRASGPKMYLALKNPSPRRNGRIPPNSGSPGKTVKYSRASSGSRDRYVAACTAEAELA
jgi:hypothetical protein